MSVWIRTIHIEELKRAYTEYKTNKTDYQKKRYHETDIVRKLEDDSCESAMECVEYIETAHLPEITLLICMCPKFSNTEYAHKYKRIRRLYTNPVGNYDLYSLFDAGVDAFEKDIIELADDVILTNLDGFISGQEKKLSDKKKELKNSKNRLSNLIEELEEIDTNNSHQSEDQILNASAKSDSSNERIDTQPEETITRLEDNSVENEKNSKKKKKGQKKQKKSDPEEIKKEIEELQSKIPELEEEIPHLEEKVLNILPYREILKAAKEGLNEKLNKSRSQLYYQLRELHLSPEEGYVRRIIAKEPLDAEFAQKMNNKRFAEEIARLLGKPEYYDVSVPSVLRLFHDGYIDLLGKDITGKSSSMFLLLLHEQHDEFLEELIYRFPQSLEGIINDGDYETYLEIALLQEIELALRGETVYYSRLWNCVEDPNIWKWIIDYTQNNTGRVERVLSVMAQSCQGRTADAFLDAYIEKGLALGALVKENLSLEKPNKEIVMKIFNKMEKGVKRLEKELKRAEATNKRHTTAVFRALSQPEENLEYLAVNVRDSSSEISNDIMANQLMDIVEKMRRGMSELEVYPVEDIETWKSSGEMAFNGQKHLYEKGDSGVSDQVKLRSLGFRYHNGDEEIQYPAHVVGTEVNSHGV